jgi:hypothetical protein
MEREAMPFDNAAANAAQHLASGATVDELRSAVQDLRDLSPDSVLATLVEEKIERLLSKEQDTSNTPPEGDATQPHENG